MKILAIRGCNLASLAGEFEIDLAHGALGGAGVFAIVGNTGAGKSTLLDALCVALFDRTPRLTNHSTVKVGRGDDEKALLGAQDVRTLLRRGAAAGYAEVDFESGDAQQYRARWSVRRARGQSDGTLQDQQLSLTTIDGRERLGGTKTETLKAIHARLGLSFDQFRRSALLAQGEFAAFLRADGKDRSELLERMTGTQIYTKLSIAAHVKATAAEHRLVLGRQAAQAIAVLEDGAREATRGALQVATAAAGTARQRHAAAEQAARWLAEAARRGRELEAARTEHAAARAGSAAAEADRAELALRRRAELLRPAWDEATRLERGLAVATGEVAAASAGAAGAAEELAAIAARRASVAALHAPVRAARIAAGLVERPVARGGELRPDDAAWLTARAALAVEVAAWSELDGRFAQHGELGGAIAALDRALAEQVEVQGKLVKARKGLASELQVATRKHEEAKRKAASFAHKRGLTLDQARKLEDEARVQLAQVEQLVAIARDARAAIEARDELDHEAAVLAKAAIDDAAERARLGGAQRIAQAVRGEQGQVVDDLRRAAGYAHARAELVDGEPCPLCGAAEHPWRDRGALDGVIAAADARLALTIGELDGIASQLAAIAARAQHHAREQARLVRERAARVAAAAAAATTWRAELIGLGELMLVDDPATPAAEALASDRQVIAKKRLEDARAQRHQTEAATKAAQDAQAEVQLCQVAVDAATTRLADHDRRGAELEAAIGRARGERTGKLDQLAALGRALTAAMTRWIAALPDDAPAAPVRSRARGESSGAEPASASGRTRGGAGSDEPASGSGRTRGGAGSEEPASGRTRVGAAGRARRSAAAVVETAAVVEADAREIRDAGEAGGDGEIDAAFAIALVGRLQASAPSRYALEGAPSSPLAIVRVAMAAVVAAWRERAERIAEADAALTAAAADVERAARDVERTAAEHAARRGEAERRRAELARELDAAAANLTDACGAAGFEPDELRRLLAADPSRVDSLVERLAALDRTIAAAQVKLGERERRVAEHAAHRPELPELPSRAPFEDAAVHGASDDADDGRERAAPDAVWNGAKDRAAPDEARLAARLAVAIEGLAAAVIAADQQAAHLAEVLAADARARERRTAALAEVAADEESVEVDRILGDVIGSHDGKLFRSFAQSLTLDGLLAVANAHLEELAPRYQLERVPRHDLELQVIDRDLGSEVRSVQSLSGGESFLVSLALALGLSSMSAHDVRVRTLLIDEGFGTLDPATLDSALSVLDALQATGRQVGVISHVPALVERVGAHVRVVQRGGGRSEVIVA